MKMFCNSKYKIKSLAVISMAFLMLCSIAGLCLGVHGQRADVESVVVEEVNNNSTSVNPQTPATPIIKRDYISAAQLKAGEENTIIESVTIESGDAETFFAEAKLTEEEKSLFVTNNMPTYSAAARTDDIKWTAKLSVGEGNYVLAITGAVISRNTPLVFPDRFGGWDIKGIVSFAFDGESLLSSVTMPAFLEFVGRGAFAGCTGLQEFAVKENSVNFATQDGVLYDYYIRKLVAYPLGKQETTFNIPSSVEYIPASAFVGSLLEEVTIDHTAIDGIFTDQDYSVEFDGDIIDAEHDLHLKPAVKLNINYFDANEEEFSGQLGANYPTTFKPGDQIELVDASRPDALFLGWYLDAGASEQYVKFLDTSSFLTDVKLYAKWDIVLELDPQTRTYFIDSANDLIELSNNSSKYKRENIIMTADIDLGFIENAVSPLEAFSGHFDGQGHSISGLVMSGLTSYCGLFSTIEENGVVENVTIASGSFSGSSYVGAIAGKMEDSASVKNCNNFATVISTNSYAGGIVGYCYPWSASKNHVGNILYCNNYGNVTGATCAGGIIGYADTYGGASYADIIYIRYCSNRGTITATSSGWYAGGIAGRADNDALYYASQVYIEYCYNRGEVVTTSGSVGGIVGYARTYYYSYKEKYGYSYFRYNYSTGSLTGTNKGGVVGEVYISSSGLNAQATITNSYWLSGTASASYGKYSSKAPTVSASTEQTQASLVAGSLTGLTSTSVWYYDGAEYPTLVGEKYTEDGVVYKTIEKQVVVDITADYDGQTHKLPATVSLIKAGAFAGATSVSLRNNVGTATAYTNAGLTTLYSGSVQDADVDLYLDWSLSPVNIEYYDVFGKPFSGAHATGYPTVHNYGTTTILSDATKDGYYFLGWFADPSGANNSQKGSIGAKDEPNSIKLYAKWAEELNYNATDGVFEISTVEDLQKLSIVVNAGYADDKINSSTIYRQVGNIDLGNIKNALTPIGTEKNPFTATYDGQGYAVDGLVIELSAKNVGLFGYTFGATLKNITIKSGAIFGESYVGAIVGRAEDYASTFTGLVNYATVTSSGSYVGGIAGRMCSENTIEYCANHGLVSGASYVGGIAGYIDSSENYVKYCYNQGNIVGINRYAGGLFGEVHVFDCYLYIQNGYSLGSVSGESYVGAVVGYYYDGFNMEVAPLEQEGMSLLGATIESENAESSLISGGELITNVYYTNESVPGLGELGFGYYCSVTFTQTTLEALKGGELTGLTDDSVWFYDGENLPLLTKCSYKENGIVYASVEKQVVIGITGEYSPSTSKVPYTVKMIESGAFAGASQVEFESKNANFVGVYTDILFANEYTNDIFFCNKMSFK